MDTFELFLNRIYTYSILGQFIGFLNSVLLLCLSIITYTLNLKDDLLILAYNKQDSEYFWCLGVFMKNEKYAPVLYFWSSIIEHLLCSIITQSKSVYVLVHMNIIYIYIYI